MLKNLTVRALKQEEYAKAGELLNREHYLGGSPQGRQLQQVVEYEDRWGALLDWGPAARKLADRDSYIGWTPQQRAERLALIVQNRRFLVLGKERMLNLASRSLGLALKALPEHGKRSTVFVLNCNEPQAHAILRSVGDYLLQLKNENRHAYQAAQRTAEKKHPFFEYTQTPDTSHGRFDERVTSVYPFEPIEAGMPEARSLVVIRRTHTGNPDEVRELAFYITTHPPKVGSITPAI